MKKTIEAFLRKDGSLRKVAVTGAGKPDIDHATIDRWQRLFALIAKEAREPAALILRVTNDSIRVLCRSDNAEQDKTEYYFGSGLYCQFIAGSSGLLIENTVSFEYINSKCAAQPFVSACFGLPVFWPDGELFGVICMMRNLKKAMTKTYKNLVSELRETFEQELASVCQQQQLLQTAETDPLTLICNRRKTESVMKAEFDRAKRYGKPFSVSIMDLNGFKRINDTYGHNAGDDVLRAFAQSVGARLRETDCLGRWGGDEFILVCPNTDAGAAQQLISRIRPAVNRDMEEMPAFDGFCYGVSQFAQTDQSYLEIVKRADEIMYKYKNNGQASAGHIA
ncbi:MAG: GGDEF domain-containing protein [Clostridiales bacterium]|nr:GGDEF domain-containing protein [Clostridiales bacterium]